MKEKLGLTPAFATSAAGEGEVIYEAGMSKRFYAACAAMQGLLSNLAMIDAHGTHDIEWISTHAFLQADELLRQEQLNQNENETDI